MKPCIVEGLERGYEAQLLSSPRRWQSLRSMELALKLHQDGCARRSPWLSNRGGVIEDDFWGLLLLWEEGDVAAWQLLRVGYCKGWGGEGDWVPSSSEWKEAGSGADKGTSPHPLQPLRNTCIRPSPDLEVNKNTTKSSSCECFDNILIQVLLLVSLLNILVLLQNKCVLNALWLRSSCARPSFGHMSSRLVKSAPLERLSMNFV